LSDASSLVRPERSRGALARTHHERPSTTLGTNGLGDGPGAEPLALYIHWPFCVSKCPYCDFNSHVRDGIDQDQWRDALLADLAYEAEQTRGHRLTSIFFGGGTPSLMPPATVAALIEAAERHWGFAPGIEITLEANPSSVEAARFADLGHAGVNRVSLGLQSLDDEALHFLGRAHDVDEGLMALGTAQSVFDRVSFDLIYALPGQSEEAWAAELERALGFGTSHLSLYQLTIEPGTRFATLAAKGDLVPADPDESASLYELTQELAGAAGLPAYEISNHARPGEESRHNLAYWRYQSYAGIGPGAHGRRTGHATQRHRKPENWLSGLARNGHGIVEEIAIPPEDARVEALLMGLRLAEGIAWAPDGLDLAAVDRLTAQGLLTRDPERLRVTPRGMLLLDGILAEIVS
jgi:oxygen-independent coproporphyrinogen-3 oxidase